jgi:hypothetical protein
LTLYRNEKAVNQLNHPRWFEVCSPADLDDALSTPEKSRADFLPVNGFLKRFSPSRCGAGGIARGVDRASFRSRASMATPLPRHVSQMDAA